MTTYKHAHPHSGGLQVPRLPNNMMRRIRLYCVLNDTKIRTFVIDALEAALNAAKVPQIKEGK